MYTDWFSYVFGAIVVNVFPMMTVIVFIDSYPRTSRYQRLSSWQASTLVTTTLLALYTYFYVHPYGEQALIAENPLWAFCVFGVILSLVLGFAKSRLPQSPQAVSLHARKISQA